MALPGAAVRSEVARQGTGLGRPFVGVVLAAQTADVPARLSGRIREVSVRLGQRVVSGQILARLDDTDARRELQIVEATLRVQKAQEARAALTVEQARVKREQVERIAHLLAGDEVTHARDAEASARADLEIARARIHEAQASVQRIQASVEDALVRATFAGSVSMRFAEPEQRVGVGAPIVRLIGNGPIRLRLAVPEPEARSLRVGDLLWVRPSLERHWTSDTAPRTPEPSPRWRARLTQISPEVDLASGRRVAEAELASPEEEGGSQDASHRERASLTGGTTVDAFLVGDEPPRK